MKNSVKMLKHCLVIFAPKIKINRKYVILLKNLLYCFTYLDRQNLVARREFSPTCLLLESNQSTLLMHKCKKAPAILSSQGYYLDE